MHITCPPQPSQADCERIVQKADMVDTVLLTLFDLHNSSLTHFGISAELIALFEKLNNKTKKVIVLLFGTPYAVNFFKQADAVLVAYEDDIDAQEAAAEVMLRKREALGKLPVYV